MRLPHDIVEKLSKNTSMGVFKGMNSDEKIISESAGNVPLSTSQFKDSPGEESSHDNAEELDVSRITIDFGNQRVARVLVDQNIVLVGLLLDLPTLVESMRGVERAIYCKIADISQMLVCFHLEDLSSAHESARDVSMLSKSSIGICLKFSNFQF